MTPFRLNLCLLVLAAPLVAAPAPKLTLKSYLEEVGQKHEGVQALKESSLGAREREGEGARLTSPNLFSNITLHSDEKPTNAPAFMGTKTSFQSFELGVNQLTSFGLAARLYYTLSLTEIQGASPTVLTQPKFWEARPTLEVSQSLWRNGFGSETRALSLLLESQTLATRYGDSFKYKGAIAEAEMAYWRLSAARELVSVQAEILESSKRLREWSARRTKMALADKSDQLQAEAGFQARSLELKAARDEMETAARAFNRMRGRNEIEVNETLDPLDPKALLSIAPTPKKGHRDDVKAAEAMGKAAEAAATVGAEKASPDLSVFGNVSLNGRDNGHGEAMSQSLKSDRPTLTAGLKFTMPLAFGSAADERRGYLRGQKAAELMYRRKLFEEDLDYRESLRKLEDAKQRLSMVMNIQKIQEEKLKHERERHRRGRSVTYQVTLFEQDYSNASALLFKTELEILGILAELKTYSEVEPGVTP